MTNSERYVVDVVLDAADRRALASVLSDPKRRDSRVAFGYTRLLLWVVLVVVALLHPIAWIAVAMEVVVVYVEHRTRQDAAAPRSAELLNGRYIVEPEGIRRRSAAGDTLIMWSSVEDVGTSRQHIFVRFLGTGWIIPHRCFASDAERAAFLAAIDRARNTPSRRTQVREKGVRRRG